MKLAFSTAWADGDVNRIIEILPHIDALEVGSKGNSNFFRDLELLVHEKSIPVTSIHAVAHPGKNTHEPYYAPELASLEEHKRQHEIEEMALTAEWANQLGAKALVLHTGKVPDEHLRSMYLSYKKNVIENKNPSHRRELFHEIIQRRMLLSREYLESVIAGLRGLCPRFPSLDFFIETRVHYYEIPIPEELDEVFTALPFRNLGYWHDIGHTYTLDALGFVSMDTWQNRFARRCGGVHIHDIDENLLDHYPPGEGILDIHRLLKQFSSNVLFTLEINSRSNTESVIRGIHHLRRDTICI